MSDPLEQLSDSDLAALSKNNLDAMSDEGLKIVASSGKSPVPAPTPEPKPEEQLGHKIIRQGLPMAGMIGGGLLGEGIGSVPLAAAGNVAGSEAAQWLNHKIYGDETPTYDSVDDAQRIGSEAAGGALAEAGGQVAGKALGAVAKSPYIKPYLDEAGQLVVNGFNKLGQYVGDAAERYAVKATGATGAQARQFAPGTGRTLLDEGVVKFGRSQSGIAGAAQDALENQGNIIQSTIDDLTKQGAAGNKSDLIAGIQSKIDELGTDPAQAQVVKQLEGIKADIAAGPDIPNLSQIENTKRGYQSMVNYANPEGNAAKAAAADVYKNAGEKAANETETPTAQAFMDAKKKYGQLAPVAEAGEKRALTTQQSPTGGLGDMVSYGVGGIPGVIAKKTIFPRIDSSMAATANSLSQILTKTPQAFGKWAPVLAKAAARGETALNASAYVLQQTDPGFREKMQEINNRGQDQ